MEINAEYAKNPSVFRSNLPNRREKTRENALEKPEIGEICALKKDFRPNLCVFFAFFCLFFGQKRQNYRIIRFIQR
jgi:hypothetical protein